MMPVLLPRLFWDFLDKHEADFANNPRMGFMLKNLRRKSDDDLEQIKKQAAAFRESFQ